MAARLLSTLWRMLLILLTTEQPAEAATRKINAPNAAAILGAVANLRTGPNLD